MTMLSRLARPSRQALQLVDSRACTHIFTRSLRTRPGQSSSPSSQPPPPEQPQDGQANAQQQTPPPPPPNPSDVSATLSSLEPADNKLLAPVHIPEDPNAILKSDHPATDILAQSGLVVTRQLEMLNVFLGFEQANKYVILDPQGNHIGYMAEQEGGIGKTMGRQAFGTHRPFTTHVFDRHAQEVLRFHRPFSVIKSRIRVYDALEPGNHIQRSSSTEISTNVNSSAGDGIHHVSQIPLEAMRIIGEAHSEWAAMRRKYNLFLAHDSSVSANGLSPSSMSKEAVPEDLSPQQKQQYGGGNFMQFAYINEPFLSWDFSLKGADERLIGSVNRNWRGFGRELFTDTGMYSLRMDSVALEDEAANRHLVSQTHKGERAYAEAVGGSQDAMGMTLDQRAVILATAVTIDFDYFSRHGGGHGLMPLPFMMGGGGGAAEAGAAGGAVGGAAEAGAGAAEAGGAVAGQAGRAVGGAAGAGEGAIAGAGTLAGYDAMQRGMGRGEYAENAAPPPDQATGAYGDPNSPQYGADDANSPQYGGGDPNSPQSGFGDGSGGDGDAWGAGDKDPWSDGGQSAGDGESGGGGLLSSLWDSFFGGD